MVGRVPTLGPTRVRFTSDRTAPVAGAWYPYTADLACELGNLSAAVSPLIGDITSISVNWQNYRRFPGLDSSDSPAIPPLMTITTPQTTATVLVIPCRTSSSLAAVLLRLAGDTELLDGQAHSLETLRGRRILSLAGQYLQEQASAAAGR
ncbi:DUF5994 family protein [Gordonia sp. DT30]|uniref:DUF5994 family protein n=1 Tax=Gordonia sp. DT30 TaxID=3416546 RepID=UPI003CEEFCE6